MDIMNLLEELDHAKLVLRQAQARNSGVMSARDGIKNILFNNLDGIVDTLKGAEGKETEIRGLKEEVNMLNNALEEADEENNKLRKELAEAQPKKKKTPPPEEE